MTFSEGNVLNTTQEEASCTNVHRAPRHQEKEGYFLRNVRKGDLHQGTNVLLLHQSTNVHRAQGDLLSFSIRKCDADGWVKSWADLIAGFLNSEDVDMSKSTPALMIGKTDGEWAVYESQCAERGKQLTITDIKDKISKVKSESSLTGLKKPELVILYTEMLVADKKTEEKDLETIDQSTKGPKWAKVKLQT